MPNHAVRLSLVILLMLAATAAAADFAGTYRGTAKGGPIAVELSADAGGYAGSIRLGDAALPCRATERDGGLAGTFAAGGQTYPFTAALAGDALTLSSGNATYHLARSTAAGEVDAKLLAAAGGGRTVFFAWPDAKAAPDALRSTVGVLRKLVGGPVTPAGGFVDSKSPANGGATFTGTTADGRAVRGTILCGRAEGGGAGGEVATVLYAPADATPAQWRTLRAALPKRPLPLHEHRFPDDTGSIGLPDGWTTATRSLDDPVLIKGPAGQVVAIGGSTLCYTPESQIVQTDRQMRIQSRQTQQQMRLQCQQMGLPLPPPTQEMPPFPSPVVPFADPPTALRQLFPTFDANCRRFLGFGVRFEQMLEARPTVATQQNGRAAQLTYTYFKVGPEGQQLQREIDQAETYPLGNDGSWIFSSTGISAPDESFDADVPTMNAILKSERPNWPVLNQHAQARTEAMRQQGQAAMAAQQRQFEAGQQAHKEQMAGYDKYNKAWADRQTAQSRSSDDFCEYLRGYRTVVDTRTGTAASVDLTSANGVASALNDYHHDPDRFVAVPLRDENHPLP